MTWWSGCQHREKTEFVYSFVLAVSGYGDYDQLAAGTIAGVVGRISHVLGVLGPGGANKFCPPSSSREQEPSGQAHRTRLRIKEEEENPGVVVRGKKKSVGVTDRGKVGEREEIGLPLAFSTCIPTVPPAPPSAPSSVSRPHTLQAASLNIFSVPNRLRLMPVQEKFKNVCLVSVFRCKPWQSTL